jgi:hypothetical protein
MTTQTMLEKVEAAIMGEMRLGTVCEDEVRDAARAALQALREPTEEMIEAMSATPTYGYPLPAEAVPDPDYIEDHRKAFMAAIDAALPPIAS